MRAADIVGIPVDDWEATTDPPGHRLEIWLGEIVLSPSPAIRHNQVGRRFANALDHQIPDDLGAVVDVEWRIVDSDGTVRSAPRPDVSVTTATEASGTGVALLQVPKLAVEILSPSDTPARQRAKDVAYANGGLRHQAKIHFTRAGHIGIAWYRADAGAWVEVARAVGTQRLTVTEPFPFTIVPDELLP